VPRAGAAAGAGGMGPLTTADSVPVTQRAVPTLGPLCRRLARREGLNRTHPRPPPRPPRCAFSRVKGERGHVQVRRRPTVSALSSRCPSAEWTITRFSPLLIEPDVRFSRIRLSDGFHTRACAGDPR
jgi:hypothetical protein